MRTNLTNLFLLLFAIILCIYPLYTTAQTPKVRTFSYDEKVDYGPDSLPRVWSQRTYDDGTVVVRVIRRNVNITTQTCLIEKLFLRIIHLNGTVDEKDIDLGIQPFNYCILEVPNGDSVFTAEFIDYFLIRKNQILVTYYNATDLNDFYTYEQWGMTIDFDGNVQSRRSFGFAFVEQNSQLLIPNADIELNVNREKGFLRIATVRNSTDAEWQQYRVEPDGTITALTYGMLDFEDFSSLISYVVSTVDEGYAIIYANTTASKFQETDPLLPLGQLFVLSMGYNQFPVSPLTLYQTSVPNVKFTSLFCNILSVGVGQVCTLTTRQTDPTGKQPDNVFYVKVNFLSSGSVSSFKVINRSFPAIENVDALGIDWVVSSLPFGGYLLTNTNDGEVGTLVYGFLFGENDAAATRWDLGEPQPSNLKAIFAILPNSTLMLSEMETSNTWSFQVIDLPKYFGDKDQGYSNINIESTSPGIQSSISADAQKVITINFYDRVDLSNSNLTIYQLDGDQSLLRQVIPGGYCTLENDSKTVVANVLDSTFSIANGNYYIKMDNDFVRSKDFKEPLLGIRDNVWSFTTDAGKKETFASSTSGLIRLTSDGTKVFDSLSSEQQNDFFNTLLEEFSVFIPLPLRRLHTSKKVQPDNSLNDHPYLISMSIEETEDNNERSVASIIKIIDTMIKNKDHTPIGTGQVTKYLDSDYGFEPKPDLWETYKFRLLGVFLIIALFIVLFLFAQRRNNEGNNIAILQLGIILFDLIMDILFVSSNARDVPTLYIPSVLFLTLPIGLNTIWAFLIITKENTRKKFYKWFTAHGKVASVFTLLAGADIEALNILQSNLAGFPFFRAPFSEEAKSKIFWGACLNIFAEDIPQVVIQVYYRFNTVNYDIIPLLTLVSSALNLTINIIGRLYQTTNYVRHKKSNSNDEEDFGDLNSSDQLEEGKLRDVDTSNEVPNSDPDDHTPPNYLGDVLKLENSEERSSLSAVINKTFNTNNGKVNNNSGNDANKNQKGLSFLKRMVSRKG